MILLRKPVGALLLALALGLIACGGLPDAPPPCPRVAIPPGAEAVTVYRPGPGPSAADLRYLAVLTDLASACRYEAGRVVVDLALTLVVARGPAYAGPARVTYVVGVVGPGGEVLARETFTAEIDVRAGAGRAAVVEELTQFIPGVTPRAGGAYRVLLGFDLSEEEAHRREGTAAGPPLPAPE